MDEYSLGPNGSLVYCMETLLENFDWLEDKISDVEAQYIIFDCPGQVCELTSVDHQPNMICINYGPMQVELYTHHTCVQDIIKRLEKMNCRLCCVCLIDSFCCWYALIIDTALILSLSMESIP